MPKENDMRSTCFLVLVLVLLPLSALSQELPVTQARNLVWLDPCPEADSSDAEVLKARIDCLERRSEAMADSQNLLLQNMFLLLEEQFLKEPAKIVERIPAVSREAEIILTDPVPTIVNCVPPLMDKAGYVLIGARLSNWTGRQVGGDTALRQCVGNNLFSRSRSEGCYVNRTWFDWYTRRAASEGSPINEAALCRNEAAEHIEETLASPRLLINDSQMDVWLDGDHLLYVKNVCSSSELHLFLHVYPVDVDDLPEHRKQHGFDNLDIEFSQARLNFTRRCVATRTLPDYPISAIRTGQYLLGTDFRSWQGYASGPFRQN